MKILLVRLSSMGDLIHTLPAISDLARHRPDVQLDWLCEENFADIARLHPFVKQILPMNWRKWRKNLLKTETYSFIQTLKNQLHTQQYDAVLDSQGLIKSAIFAKMANAPIWGLDKNSAREPLASCFYEKKWTVPRGQDAIWRNRQLFAQAFDYSIENEKLNFGVKIPHLELEPNFIPEKPYFVALHATSKDSKLWKTEHWFNLFQKIHAQNGAEIWLTWGNPTEQQRAQKMAENLPFVRVCPKLNLLQAAQLLQGAQAVIGVDTGLLHLANAVDVPVIGIYTDSDPIKTGVQVSDYAKNIGGIGQMPSVDAVWELLQICLHHQSN